MDHCLRKDAINISKKKVLRKMKTKWTVIYRIRKRQFKSLDTMGKEGLRNSTHTVHTED